MKFGICAPLEHAALLADLGADYIELPLAPTLQPETAEQTVMPNLTAQLADTSLRPETFNIFLPGDLKVVGPSLDRERQHQYLAAAVTRAAALGAKVLVLGSGGSRRIPDGFDRQIASGQFEEFLKSANAVAEQSGLVIAIEPLNRGECNYLNSVAEVTALAQKLALPSLRVLSDLYHISEEGQSYDETGDAGALLAHVHVAGAQDRRAPIQDDLNFLASYFHVLKRIGYNERISIECQWSNIGLEAASSLAVLRQAWVAA